MLPGTSALCPLATAAPALHSTPVPLARLCSVLPSPAPATRLKPGRQERPCRVPGSDLPVPGTYLLWKPAAAPSRRLPGSLRAPPLKASPSGRACSEPGLGQHRLAEGAGEEVPWEGGSEREAGSFSSALPAPFSPPPAPRSPWAEAETWFLESKGREEESGTNT